MGYCSFSGECLAGDASGPTTGDCATCQSYPCPDWTTDASSCSSRRLEVEAPLDAPLDAARGRSLSETTGVALDLAQGRSLSETVANALDLAAGALRSVAWAWFGVPGFWILFLMLMGVAFGTASIAGSGNRCHATTGSVFLGIASFFSILGTISGIALGAVFSLGASFLSSAFTKGLTCPGDSTDSPQCKCVDALDGILHQLGVGGWVTFVVMLFTTIVAIGGASSLSKRASETQATQLMAVGVEINPNQLPGPQK